MSDKDLSQVEKAFRSIINSPEGKIAFTYMFEQIFRIPKPIATDEDRLRHNIGLEIMKLANLKWRADI